MPNPERQRLLRMLKDGIETGKTADAGGVVRSPVKDFTCPDLLAQEQRIFFRETPLLMGLSSDLPVAGSYWADSETGLPILMTRGEDGEFHAFANVCRHRGMQVVPDGRGEQVRFSCPIIDLHLYDMKNLYCHIIIDLQGRGHGHAQRKTRCIPGAA